MWCVTFRYQSVLMHIKKQCACVIVSGLWPILKSFCINAFSSTLKKYSRDTNRVGGRFWPLFHSDACLQRKIIRVFQCLWSLHSTVGRYAVTFLTRSYKYTPSPYIPQTLLTYFPTHIHKQTHQQALHNIRLSLIHTHTFVFLSWFFYHDCHWLL